MNDDTFLYAYRRPPDPHFAGALYRRISAEEPRVTITFSFSPLVQFKRKVNILGGALAVLVALSPDTRTKLWSKALAF